GAPDTPNHPELDVSDKPEWVRRLDWTDEKEAEVDRVHSDGARCMKSVDEGIVAILDALDHAGRLDDALVILTNDNGWCAGSHRWDQKRVAYEESARVFFLAASRRRDVISTTHVVDQLVGNVDIAPTLAEIAGTRPATPVDGVSFASLLRAPGGPVRDALLLQYWSD